MEQSTFWSEEHLARISQSPVSERDWMVTVATSPSNFLGLLIARGPDGWSGRTSPEFYQAYPTTLPIHVRRQIRWIWNSTDRKWTLKTSTIQKSYTPSTASWPDFQNSATGGPQGFSTLNTSEFHSAAAASSLSDILETGAVPQRYFLSPTACKGILRRAEKRGKSLPPSLQDALEAVASGPTSTAMGGAIASSYWDGSDTADTLDASNASKQQAMPEKRRFQAVITHSSKPVGSFEQNSMAGRGTLGWSEGDQPLRPVKPQSDHQMIVTHSLRADGFDASEDGTGRGTPIVPIHTTGDGYWREGFGTLRGREQDSHENLIAFSCKDAGLDSGDLAPTLRGMGHDTSHANAGGQVAIAFDTTQITSPGNYSQPKPGDPCHPLAAEAHVPAVAFNLRGRDCGALPEVAEVASVRAASGGSSRTYVAQMAVRRLTPVECERLQGFRDNWTKISDKTADGPRYKALGNSMAVPVMKWIGERIQIVDNL